MHFETNAHPHFLIPRYIIELQTRFQTEWSSILDTPLTSDVRQSVVDGRGRVVSAILNVAEVYKDDDQPQTLANPLRGSAVNSGRGSLGSDLSGKGARSNTPGPKKTRNKQRVSMNADDFALEKSLIHSSVRL